MGRHPVTVSGALRFGAERLASREDLRNDARQDAQQLLEIATGRTRVQMLARPEAALDPEEQARYNELLEQRLQAVPIQYLRGFQEFYGRSFRVTPDVLIPRPETEDIIAAVLERTPDRRTPLKILDVGTGSGAIALTLALELPASTVTALDISPAALQVARENAALLAAAEEPTLTRRVRFLESDLLAALGPDERFDVIVSNPPYIPTIESASLHAQVRDYEPHLALFGGEDGHAVFRRLIPMAEHALFQNGILILETAGVSPLLRALLKNWANLEVRSDLRGVPRMIAATRPAAQL